LLNAGDENRFDIFIESNSYDAKGKEMTDDGRGMVLI
jgi:hypothetical protein